MFGRNMSECLEVAYDGPPQELQDRIARFLRGKCALVRTAPEGVLVFRGPIMGYSWTPIFLLEGTLKCVSAAGRGCRVVYTLSLRRLAHACLVACIICIMVAVVVPFPPTRLSFAGLSAMSPLLWAANAIIMPPRFRAFLQRACRDNWP